MASPSDILDGLIATMNNAADALMRHQGQANKVRTKATRTTNQLLCSRQLRPGLSPTLGDAIHLLLQHGSVQLLKRILSDLLDLRVAAIHGQVQVRVRQRTHRAPSLAKLPEREHGSPPPLMLGREALSLTPR